MYKIFFVTILLVVLSFALSGQNSDSLIWIDEFLNDADVKHSPVSICVEQVGSNKTLLDINTQLSLVPASTLKLVTTSAAMEILGPDYRFSTTVAFRGAITDSVLNGDLIVIGGGDPSLGSAYLFGKNKHDFLKKWALLVKQNGIKKITGNIIVDPNIYTDQDVPQTWIWEDLGNYFGAAAQGISLYDNTFKIVFETSNTDGGTTEILGTEPFIPNLNLENQVKASQIKRDKAYVYGSPFDSFRTIKGTLPKGASNFKIKASIPDPSLLLGFELQKSFTLMGIDINGEAISLKNNLVENPIDSTLFTWNSPPLNEIINQINYESINLFAEHLCKQIGLQKSGIASTASGAKAIKRFWTQKGIDTEFMFLSDGSGLSRANSISAGTLVDILCYMQTQSEHAATYKKSIPLTGLQGTQKYYFQDSFLKGKAQAKSGSMTRVRSFAGYITTAKGKDVSFAIIVNNFNCSSFTMAHKMEKLIEEIYLNF